MRLLNESNAIDLALERVNGEVDNINFIERDDQTPYYLIEVETNDDREVVVKINAYKREVITVTWEDENGRGF